MKINKISRDNLESKDMDSQYEDQPDTEYEDALDMALDQET